jgi:ABC-type multidrug transport system fused ATPase/permease subunit
VDLVYQRDDKRSKGKEDLQQSSTRSGFSSSRILMRGASRYEEERIHSRKIALPSEEESKKWEDRERKLVEKIAATVKWYKRHASRNYILHVLTSVIILLGGILAPFLIASTGLNSGSNSLNIPTNVAVWGSTLITMMMGISEGFRRLFQFHDKWKSFYTTNENLVRIRETYREPIVT